MTDALPTYDRESELYQERFDRALKRLDNGDFDMSDVRDAFFNVPQVHQLKFKMSVSAREGKELVDVVRQILLNHFVETNNE